MVVDGAGTRPGRTNSLIRLNGGTLRLEEWTVLQNNFSHGDGGGVYLDGGAATETICFLTENAVIRHCEAGTAGGGIYASFRNPDVPSTLHLGGCCLITGNRAVLGGGVAVRHLPRRSGRVSGCRRADAGRLRPADGQYVHRRGRRLAYLNDAGTAGIKARFLSGWCWAGKRKSPTITRRKTGGGSLRSQHPSRRQRRCAGQRAADREHRQHGRRPFRIAQRRRPS